MDRKIQEKLDKWYNDYIKLHGEAPTWIQLMLKTHELEEIVKRGN